MSCRWTAVLVWPGASMWMEGPFFYVMLVVLEISSADHIQPEGEIHVGSLYAKTERINITQC